MVRWWSLSAAYRKSSEWVNLSFLSEVQLLYFLLLYLPCYCGDVGLWWFTERFYLHNRQNVIWPDIVCHSMVGRKWVMVKGWGGILDFCLFSLLEVDWTHIVLLSWIWSLPFAHKLKQNWFFSNVGPEGPDVCFYISITFRGNLHMSFSHYFRFSL